MSRVAGIGGILLREGKLLDHVSLLKAVELAQQATRLPIIYSYVTLPYNEGMGEALATRMQAVPVNAVMLWPYSGPEAQKDCTTALLEQKLGVICAGQAAERSRITATHDGSNGGFLAVPAQHRMSSLAIELGVRDFVIPSNQRTLSRPLVRQLGTDSYTRWTHWQGGGENLPALLCEPEPRAHFMVGSEIWDAPNPCETAQWFGQTVLESLKEPNGNTRPVAS